MMDILHIYIFSETEKNLITGIEMALSWIQVQTTD